MIDRVPDDGRAGPVAPPVPECWRVIGVGGDRSCPELARFIHCRNCPVLADAARAFFERPAPPGYLDAWQAILEEPADEPEADATSLLVFRAHDEWLALPATTIVEVTTPRRIHSVPHRAGTPLAGLVNIRGQLQPCLSLHALLGLVGGPVQPGLGGSARLLVVEPAAGELWVLGVDEVAGVHRVPRGTLRPVPATLGQATAHCASALVRLQDRPVALLDEGLLLGRMREAVTA